MRYMSFRQRRCGQYFRSLISLSELKQDKTTMLAILRRLIDLKEENLVQEWKKQL